MKRLWIPATAAVVFGCFGLAFVAGCVVSDGIHFVTNVGQAEKAERTDTLPLKLAEGGTLAIDLSHGDVVVHADAVGEPRVVAKITAYGKTTDAAQLDLDATKLVVEETSAGARLHLAGEPVERRSSGLTTIMRPSADLELHVPKDVHFTVALGSGDIRTHGPIGASRLKSSYGDVQVESATGDLELDSSSGKVELGGASGAKRVTLHSSYGDLAAQHVEADEVQLDSSSGTVRLADSSGKRIELRSSYGDVSARHVAGELVAKTSSGDVKVEDLRGATATLTSGYGDVLLDGFQGDLSASTSSGTVAVKGFTGTCELKSSYGDVRAEGRIDRLQARSNSGSVRVRALSGSTLEGDWKLASGYGDVELMVPAGLSFELVAKTGYGSLDVQVPVTVPAGGFKNERKLEGRVGDGGKRIELTTSSGNVRLGTQP